MNTLCIAAADFGPHMLTFVSEDRTSSALFALLAPAAVRADAAPAALFAQRALAAVWTAMSAHAGW